MSDQLWFMSYLAVGLAFQVFQTTFVIILHRWIRAQGFGHVLPDTDRPLHVEAFKWVVGLLFWPVDAAMLALAMVSVARLWLWLRSKQGWAP